MIQDGLRYCTYCRCRKPAGGFKAIRDKRGHLRNRKCADCDAKKKLSVQERDARAEKLRQEQKEADARRMREVTAAREQSRAQRRLNNA